MTETRDLTPRDPRTPEELAAARSPVVDDAEVPRHIDEPGLEELAPPPLTEADVRRWLDRVGRVMAWVVGRFTRAPEGLTDPVAELEPPPWRFTEEELTELAPPATRVLNRRVLWLAGVIRNADEIELGFLLLEYVDANIERVRQARDAAEAEAATDTRADLEEGDPGRGPGSFGIGDEG